ncbi:MULTISPECIES: transcriptional regulator GcvA [Brevundimonas]|nr:MULTISPECIES: transcriptional regulator GcvA [Brevundimonas]MBK1967739.1 transcriptional regulator GcvA [Brevundimonas diminuta]MDA0742335.1 transcriptional regulator GcvA [Pseudomonadota bacterium]MDM8353373.1 transcriptional regulator GcvA [Brevundimonas diminuta]
MTRRKSETALESRIPPLNALKAFEAAARRLNITRAAEELSVTPGAISQQIRILEQHAGAPLFHREGRQIALTDLGAELYPLLRDGFDHLKRAGDLLYRPDRRHALAVSVPPSFAAKWLAPRIARFSAAHSEIEVWMSADMRLADVSGGRVDVAVRYGRGDYPGVRSERLLNADVTPVCAPGLLVGRQPLRKPADLAHHVLIHLRPSEWEEPRPDWGAWLKARDLTDIDAQAGPRFDQTALAIEAAAHGQGVALAPYAFVADDLAAGRLVAPFADGALTTDFAYYVLIKRSGATTAARTFVAWLKEEAHAAAEAGVDDL